MPYAIVRDTAGPVALVQHGVLQIHVWGSRRDNLDAPDRIVFDLDPAPEAGWAGWWRRRRSRANGCGISGW